MKTPAPLFLVSVYSDQRPNVLFLVIDDLRPALGSYSYPQVLTPNIDWLAAQSLQFNNAHAQVGPYRVVLSYYILIDKISVKTRGKAFIADEIKRMT